MAMGIKWLKWSKQLKWHGLLSSFSFISATFSIYLWLHLGIAYILNIYTKWYRFHLDAHTHMYTRWRIYRGYRDGGTGRRRYSYYIVAARLLRARLQITGLCWRLQRSGSTRAKGSFSSCYFSQWLKANRKKNMKKKKKMMMVVGDRNERAKMRWEVLYHSLFLRYILCHLFYFIQHIYCIFCFARLG